MNVGITGLLYDLFGSMDLGSRLIPRPGKGGSAISSYTKNARYFEKKIARNRRRNKIARRSRRINRMRG